MRPSDDQMTNLLQILNCKICHTLGLFSSGVSA